MSRVITASSLTFFLGLAFCQHGCGRALTRERSPGGTTTILDDDVNVADATAFEVAAKSELDAVVIGSRSLADLAAGRLFDFDDSLFAAADATSAALQPDDDPKGIFCQDEVPLLEEAKVENNRLFLRYEADVTACARQPSNNTLLVAGDNIQVDRQVAAFAMTFTCSARSLAAPQGSSHPVRSLMAAPAAFACPAKGSQPVTGRAWRFVTRTEGRYPGPRSDVPVEQRFWRGYDSGEASQPCLLTRDAAVAGLGACRVWERSESRNLVDNSRRGRVLVAAATARKRAANLFADGSLNIRFNGWTGVAQFSSQDTDIKVKMIRPNGECAGFLLRPVMSNFDSTDCR